MLREHADERALGPVIDVTWGIAEAGHILAAGNIDDPPKWLARDGNQEMSGGTTSHFSDGVFWVGNVLKHFDRRRHSKLAICEGEISCLNCHVLKVWSLTGGPFGLQLFVVEVNSDDATAIQLVCPLLCKNALSTANVKD